jgi:hypothetical protein
MVERVADYTQAEEKIAPLCALRRFQCLSFSDTFGA